MIKLFEHVVKFHSIDSGNLLYNSNALMAEAGEAANIVKKIKIRDYLKEEELVNTKSVEEYRKDLNNKLGDALFYLTRLALDNNTDLREIIRDQIIKLKHQTEEYKRTFKK